MHDELIAALRGPYNSMTDIQTKKQAADAIVELQKAVNFHKFNSEFWEDKYNSLADEKWIPVAERLPEARHDVLVYAGVLFSYIAVGYYDGLWKFSFDDSEIAGGVDYWMPLPQPPKEEKDKND